MTSRLLHAVLLLSSLAAADDVAAIAARLDTESAREAAERLAELGPAAKAAVPQLVAALGSEDPELRWRAGWALSRMGREAAPAAQALVLAAMKEDGLPAVSAYIALKRIGDAATDAVLVSMLEAPEHERAKYLPLLKQVEPSPDAVPALLPFLTDRDKRSEVCMILRHMGRLEAALPALVRCVRDEPLSFSAQALIAAIGEPGIAPLRDLAMDGTATPDARAEAIDLLVRLGDPGLAAAKKCLRDVPQGDLWDSFARKIAAAGPRAADLAPLVEERIQEGDISLGTVATLLPLGPAGEAVLEKALFPTPAPSNLGDFMRSTLVHQLLGRDSPKVVAWLFRLAEPGEPKMIRSAALRGLARTSLDAAASRSAAMLADRDLKTNMDVACELAGSLGPAGGRLAPKLRVLLSDREPRARAAAASALCRMGKGGAKEAAILAKAVESETANPNRWRRDHAIRCLADAGPSAAAHYGLLLAALEKPDTACEATRGLLLMLPALGDNKDRALDALRTRGRWAALLICETDGVPTLIELLRADLHARDACDRLVELGARSWEPLVGCIDSESPPTRCHAARALLRIDAKRAEERVWQIALSAPGGSGIGDVCQDNRQAAIPNLMRGLGSDDPTARAEAASLIASLGHADAVPVLRGLVADDKDALVRSNALRALDALLTSP